MEVWWDENGTATEGFLSLPASIMYKDSLHFRISGQCARIYKQAAVIAILSCLMLLKMLYSCCVGIASRLTTPMGHKTPSCRSCKAKVPAMGVVGVPESAACIFWNLRVGCDRLLLLAPRDAAYHTFLSTTVPLTCICRLACALRSAAVSSAANLQNVSWSKHPEMGHCPNAVGSNMDSLLLRKSRLNLFHAVHGTKGLKCI